jgi:lipoate-protein ligase A
MRFVSLTSTDPAFNLAVEEVLVRADDGRDVVMLWQNHRTVVIGRNQDAQAQVNRDVLKSEGITLVRRLSGGGAVYHDDGNLNFSVITRGVGSIKPDFSFFTQPLIEAIGKFGVKATFSGRNDVEVDGKKICGNAQYRWRDTVMHHGAILFDTDLSVLARVLKPKERQSKGFKGVKSHVSRVVNLREYLNCSLEEFRGVLTDCLLAQAQAQGSPDCPIASDGAQLSDAELRAAHDLADLRYRHDSWNWRAVGRAGDEEYREESGQNE